MSFEHNSAIGLRDRLIFPCRTVNRDSKHKQHLELEHQASSLPCSVKIVIQWNVRGLRQKRHFLLICDPILHGNKECAKVKFELSRQKKLNLHVMEREKQESTWLFPQQLQFSPKKWGQQKIVSQWGWTFSTASTNDESNKKVSLTLLGTATHALQKFNGLSNYFQSILLEHCWDFFHFFTATLR